MVGAERVRPAGHWRLNRAVTSWLAAAVLTGCAVGPDFLPPASPRVTGYTSVPLSAQTASAATLHGEPQRVGVGTGIGASWWQALGSPQLDTLIEQALKASPTLAAAEATLRQAREWHAAQAGSTLYPRVDANAGAQRQRTNPSAQGQAGAGHEFSMFSASMGVRYRLDLSGGNQRALEALAARSEHRRYQLEGARLSLAGGIAQNTIARARLSGQVAAMQVLVQMQEEQLELTRQRVRLGQAAGDEVLALQAQLEQTRAGMPALRKQLEHSEHLLAVLAGQAPGAATLPEFRLADFVLPTDLPLVLPSELVRRRPDIRAAEALLHAANAEYGVAVARLYPRVDLSASLGTQALTVGSLFGAGSAAWGLLAQLTQPLFDAGLPAEKRAALAAFDAAAANYQGVVLDALLDVADALRALDHDAQTIAAQAAADGAARASLASTERQYRLGAVSYVQVLIARQQVQQSQNGLIAAQAQRLLDSAAFLQALGGGGEPETPDNGV